MKLVILLGMGLAGLCGPVWAQNCPEGIPSAGNPACIPPDRENSPYYQGHGGSNQAAVPPLMKWADRWGAIATDGPSASLGTAVGMSSKRKAEKIALTQCRAKGGANCKVDLAYYNQCAVLVSGDSKYLIQGAATIDEASEIAVRRCNAEDVNCRVHYDDCSMAERIQ